MARKSNTNLVLSLILIGLLAMAAGLKFFGSNPYETGESVKAAQSMFSDFKSESVARLSIKGPKDATADLELKDGRWIVASDNGYHADKSQVEQALKALQEMKQGKVVSSNDASFAQYDLEGENSIHVGAYDSSGKSLADVTIGKTSADFQSTFIRAPGGSDVRKVSDSVRDDFDKSGTYQTWRDKTILDAGSEDEVESITVVGPKTTLALKKERVMGPKEDKPDSTASGDPTASGETTHPTTGEGTDPTAKSEPEMEVKETHWNLEAPSQGRAKKWQVDSMARAMAKLTCDSFYTGTKSSKELGLDPPVYQITAILKKSEGEKKVTLWMGEKEEDKYPVKLPDQDTIWLVASYRGDSFTKPPEELLDTPPKEEGAEAQEGESDPDADAAEQLSAPPSPDSSSSEGSEGEGGESSDDASETTSDQETPPSGDKDGSGGAPDGDQGGKKDGSVP